MHSNNHHTRGCHRCTIYSRIHLARWPFSHKHEQSQRAAWSQRWEVALSVCGRREPLASAGECSEQAGEAFGHCSPEWVNEGANSAPVLTGRHSAKSGMCVTRDHTATHPKGSLNDSSRAQEKAGGKEGRKNQEKTERKRVTGTPYFIELRYSILHRCCIFYELKARPSTCKKITTCFVAILTLRWSGAEPTTTPTVCPHFCRQALNAAEPRGRCGETLWLWCSWLGLSGTLGTLHKGDEPFTG